MADHRTLLGRRGTLSQPIDRRTHHPPRLRRCVHMTEFITELERFQQGGFPMVCVRSGLPADKFVPVQAERKSVGWWAKLDSMALWILDGWFFQTRNPWGRLPFATGQVGGIEATCHPRRDQPTLIKVLGAHPNFIDAAA